MVVTSRYIASLPAGLVFPDEAMKTKQTSLFDLPTRSSKVKVKWNGIPLKSYGNRLWWERLRKRWKISDEFTIWVNDVLTMESKYNIR